MIFIQFASWFDSRIPVTCLFQESSPNQGKKHTDVLVGAPTEADVDDSYIRDISSFALAEIDRRSNALYRQKVVRIVEAQKQVNQHFFSVWNPFHYTPNGL
jgi:hypothetical protein